MKLHRLGAGIANVAINPTSALPRTVSFASGEPGMFSVAGHELDVALVRTFTLPANGLRGQAHTGVRGRHGFSSA